MTDILESAGEGTWWDKTKLHDIWHILFWWMNVLICSTTLKKANYIFFKNIVIFETTMEIHTVLTATVLLCVNALRWQSRLKDHDGYCACTFLKINWEKDNAVLSFYMRVHV